MILAELSLLLAAQAALVDLRRFLPDAVYDALLRRSLRW